jgi:hypothetical protein
MARSPNPTPSGGSTLTDPVGSNAGSASLIGDSTVGSKSALDQNINQNSGGTLDGRSFTNGDGGGPTALGTNGTAPADITGSPTDAQSGGLLNGVSNMAKKAAGQIDNLLSLIRGTNLPDRGEVFKKQNVSVGLTQLAEADWRVRIGCNWNVFGTSHMFGRLQATGGVVFPVLPSIRISTQANYTAIEPTHSNFATQVYKNSTIGDITIEGEFPAENEVDADYWLAATTFFKTATKMFYGQGAYAGNPPVICTLSGYGTSILGRVPVVIKSFEVSLPNDVNYIKLANEESGSSTWVPVLSTITIVVAPVYNRANMRKFSLADYAKGDMIGTDGSGLGYL